MGLILLVEDDSAVASALSFTFRAFGHEAMIAPSVARASEILVSRCPDVVVADEALGDGRGSELLRYIAVQHGHVGRVLLTGLPDDIEVVLPAGTLVRRKPWDLVDVERTLDALLAPRT